MKIKLEHISNTYNYGSLMMAINLINRLKMDFEGIEIYTDASTNEDLERIKIETNYDKVYKISTNVKEESYSKIKKYVQKIKNNTRLANEESKLYDIKIILGGDDISEYYGKNQWLVEFPMMQAAAKKIPTILLGQTIGPFTSYRKILARLALNQTKIYTRDDKCLKYLKELGVSTVSKGRDLAFLELENKNNKKIIEKYNLIKNSYLTIVPSGLVKLYTNNFDDYINEMCNIINNLGHHEKLKNVNIVLLPHVLLPANVDDRIVINEILNKLDSDIKHRIVSIDEEMLSSEAREVLGNGLFTITGRMHAAVSTFYMRIPAISLSYSVKYAGVIGDGLDMNELIIESANDKLWKERKISELVSEKVDYVLDNYDELINKIDKNVSKTSEIVKKQLDDLINEIKKLNKK